MGTWGNGAFDNDDAADFIAEYKGSKNNFDVLEKAIDFVSMFAQDEYLEAPDAQRAIAAAKIIQDSNNPDLIRRTKEKRALALNRILSNSELQELWKESDEYDQWTNSVRSLI